MRPANFYIDVEKVGGFESALRKFHQRSFGLVGEMKSRQFFSRKRKNGRGRKQRITWEQRSSLFLSPLGRAVAREPLPPQSQVSTMRPSTHASVGHIDADATTTVVESKTVQPPVAIKADTEGTMIIIKFMSARPTFAIIKDIKKEKLGFPYGGKDEPEENIFDKDIFATAERECKEEIFRHIDTCLTITEENLLGSFKPGDTHTIFVFCVEMPPEMNMNPGKEQHVAFRVSAEKIEQYIKDGIFLRSAVTGWQMYKHSILQ